ncbi:MAG: ATP-binding cassette domain-containing protein [Actinobacteria bacterium]|nr:ATP-binding cassette domain-containing protein [Actinomycetota bacterium]
MTGLAVQAEGLGKRYRLGEGGYSTLRDKVGAYLRPRPAHEHEAREVWALRDLDLEIGEGDIVGIVGRNGAGKTTFLKTVARIVRPSTGVVRVRGRVGALLEVGTGFHPELTGRENVFLNGVVLGMSRQEVRRRFDEIVEFAGVERFLDTPLKRYSSGMSLRLAFAVAAHIEPDVVIVDEVLAVGDAEFQRRCLGRMAEFGQEGRTVLFVSHDTGVVGRLCRRAIWLEDGGLRDDGPALDVLDRYLGSVSRGVSRASPPVAPGGPIHAVSLSLVDATGAPLETARRDEALGLRLRFSLLERMPGLDAALYLVDRSGTRIVNENVSDGAGAGRLGGPPGERDVLLTVPPILAAGPYVVGVWIGTPDETFVSAEVLELDLLPLPDDQSEARHGVVRPPVSWHVRTEPFQEGATG